MLQVIQEKVKWLWIKLQNSIETAEIQKYPESQQAHM